MSRITEKPLTTAALQKFLETVEKEVSKTQFKDGTKHDFLLEVIMGTMPIDQEGPRETIVLDIFPPRGGKNTMKRSLPLTLNDLSARFERITTDFVAHDEVSDEPSKSALKSILEKALRSAAKEMTLESSRSR